MNLRATEATDDLDSTTTVDRILAALVEVILEGGLPGFSVQEVADRAGISHRTVADGPAAGGAAASSQTPYGSRRPGRRPATPDAGAMAD